MSVTKGEVVALATRQSQTAQYVTRALRAHGWKTRYIGDGKFGPADPAYRRAQLRQALNAAREVQANAGRVVDAIARLAIKEGAIAP